MSEIVYARRRVDDDAGVGRNEHLPVQRDDGQELQETAGWDPARSCGARVPGQAPPIVRAAAEPRRASLAIGRSWSNAVTRRRPRIGDQRAMATGRRRSIERVIRTSAPVRRLLGRNVVTADALLGVAAASPSADSAS